MRGLLMVLLTTSVLFAGCSSFWPDGRACTMLYAYGVSANVTDADTGEAVTNATLTLQDGDYTEVMEGSPSGGYVGAGERPGTYTLTIEVPGVPSETVPDIVVGFDGCHVIGVALDIQVESDRIVVTR